MIVLILGFSIYKIRKFSKMLVQSQIFANECLMVSHLAAFAFFTVLNTYTQTLNFRQQGKEWPETLNEMTDKQKSTLLSATIAEYLKILGCLSIVFTMLVMFFKHSQSKKLVSEEQQKEIIQRFMLVFSGMQDLGKINEARIN